MSGFQARGKTALQRILNEQRMSHYELAQRSGVSREHICRIANGTVPRVAIVPQLVAIAWALDVPLTELAEHSDWLPIGPRPERLPLRPEQVAS